MNEILNQLGPVDSFRNRQEQLKQERINDMKQFMANQAANSHPRLQKLMKTRQNLGDTIHYIENRRGNHDDYGQKPETFSNPQSNQVNRQGDFNLPKQDHPGISLPPISIPPPTQYPNQGFYMQGWRPPPLNQFDSVYNPLPMYPMPNYPYMVPYQHAMNMPPPMNHAYRNDATQTTNPALESRKYYENRNEITSRNVGSDRRHPKILSKDEYAMTLENQLREREQQKQQELEYRRIPEKGFFTNNMQYSTVNQYGKNYANRESEHSEWKQSPTLDRQKQALYGADLAEQIRLKREREAMSKQAEYIQESNKPVNNYSPTLMNLNLEGRSSRKKFPQEDAKLRSSVVFPSYNSPISNYSALPSIESSKHLGYSESFPPPPQNGQSFIRGQIPIENMPPWQREEYLAREQKRKKHQDEIQNVLKQQMAEKEMEKQRKLQEQKLEDEREAQRIEKEQIMLHNKYAKEKEEARILEEQKLLENQKKALEKKMIQDKLEADIMAAPSNKRTSLRDKIQAHKQESEKLEPIEQNFRSNSPPLPATLKKMKSSGIGETLENSQGSNIPAESNMPLSKQGQEINAGFNSSSELLRQLSEIQNELQIEDQKVQMEIKMAEAMHSNNKLEQLVEDPLSLPEKRAASRDTRRTGSYRNVETPIEKYHERKSGYLYEYRNDENETYNLPPSPNEYNQDLRRHSAQPTKTPQNPSNFIPEKLIDADSQILEITKNMNSVMEKVAPRPSTRKQLNNIESSINLEEIENRNTARLRVLENDQPSSNEIDILASFLANNSSGQQLIPTSPSVFQKINYHE